MSFLQTETCTATSQDLAKKVKFVHPQVENTERSGWKQPESFTQDQLEKEVEELKYSQLRKIFANHKRLSSREKMVSRLKLLNLTPQLVENMRRGKFLYPKLVPPTSLRIKQLKEEAVRLGINLNSSRKEDLYREIFSQPKKHPEPDWKFTVDELSFFLASKGIHISLSNYKSVYRKERLYAVYCAIFKPKSVRVEKKVGVSHSEVCELCTENGVECLTQLNSLSGVYGVTFEVSSELKYPGVPVTHIPEFPVLFTKREREYLLSVLRNNYILRIHEYVDERWYLSVNKGIPVVVSTEMKTVNPLPREEDLKLTSTPLFFDIDGKMYVFSVRELLENFKINKGFYLDCQNTHNHSDVLVGKCVSDFIPSLTRCLEYLYMKRPDSSKREGTEAKLVEVIRSINATERLRELVKSIDSLSKLKVTDSTPVHTPGSQSFSIESLHAEVYVTVNRGADTAILDKSCSERYGMMRNIHFGFMKETMDVYIPTDIVKLVFGFISVPLG